MSSHRMRRYWQRAWPWAGFRRVCALSSTARQEKDKARVRTPMRMDIEPCSCQGRALDAVVASALHAAAERREDELVNLTGPRVYHWQARSGDWQGPAPRTPHRSMSVTQASDQRHACASLLADLLSSV